MLEPDFTQAATFLGALTGGDGWNTPVTFQLFDDSPMKRPTMAGIINGTLADFAEEARAANNRGAGIFVTVQGTNGRGRTTEDIILPRAVFIDADDHEERTFALPPSITVRTANGAHAYWLLSGYAPLGELPPMLRRLAAFYRTDPSVCDLARVMRLPGTWHCKGEPSPVLLTHADTNIRYTLDALRDAHPAVMREYPREHAVVNACEWENRECEERRYRNWASCKDVTKGVRHKTAYSIAAEGLKRALTYDVVEATVAHYCDRAGLTTSDVRDVMKSATKAHQRRA